MAGIQRLLAFQTVLDGIFERFVGLDGEGFDDAIDRALEDIGRFVGSDRAYVVSYDADAQLTWMTHEWCAPGVEPSFDDEQGRSFAEAPMQQARLERFEVNEIRDVGSLRGEWVRDREYLEQQGIAAILEVPLVRNDELVGVIGLDSTAAAIPWTAEDVTVLRAVAALFAQVAERRLADGALAVAGDQLRTTVEALRRAEARFVTLVDRLPVGVARVDVGGTVVLSNRALSEDPVTTSELDRVAGHGPLADAVAATLADGTARDVEFSAEHGDQLVWRDASVQPEIVDGEVVSVLVVVDDTTERHEHEAELVRAATHDALTGLPNRTMVAMLLERAASTIGRTVESLAFLFVDLDEFKMVNDSLGHDIGDDVLVAVADRFRSVVPPTATVARLGGDEFAVLLEDHDEVEASAVAARLLGALAAPVVLGDAEFRTSAAVGVAVATSVDQIGDLMRSADVAMYRAKRAGRGRVEVHDLSLSQSVAAELELDQRLRRAVEADEFHVAYQPVVDLSSGRLIGAEALVRWRPDGGAEVSAAEFIPLAERNGTVLAIGRSVLRTACATVAQWIADGTVGGDFVLAVNLSARQLDDPRCLSDVLEVMGTTSIPPGNLCLEVTETAALSDVDRADGLLADLRRAGVRVALDDFGTGYGSLQLVQQLPLDQLKIDRTFVSRLPADRTAAALVRAVVELARTLDLEVIAEGIADEEQRAAVLALGCTAAQGFLLGRPVEADAFRRAATGA